MIAVEQIDPSSRRQRARFVELPYRLYAGSPHWVPPLRQTVNCWLSPDQHPFYTHSTAEFFVAVENGRDVGRIAALEHRPFNTQQGVRQAHFYGFESENNPAIAAALLDRVAAWAKARQLDTLIGPKGFSVLDGFGILIDGFEQQQLMNLTNYTLPYYPALLEGWGFTKMLDLISCRLEARSLKLPPWLDELADWARQKSGLQVHGFTSLHSWAQNAPRILRLYNHSLKQNWEYYPFSEQEMAFVLDSIKPTIHPQLVKVLSDQSELAGVLIVLPDLTAALRRAQGRLTPLSIADLLLAARRRPRSVAVAALGVLPEYRLRGGNALLFAELLKTVTELGIQHAELVQIPETATEMRRDLSALGIPAYKTHRVYRKQL